MKNKLVLLSIFHFINDGLLASIILILPFIQKDINLTLTQIGFLSSILYFTGILLSIPSSLIANKFGSINILFISIILNSLGFIFLSFSHHYYLIIISFIIAALGFGIFHPISFALVTHWSKTNIGRSMGNFTSLGEIGRLFLSTILSFIIIYLGWKYTALSYGIVPIVLIIIIIFFNKKIKVNFNLEENKNKISFKDVIKNKQFIFALLTNFFDNFASSSLFTFLPFLLIFRQIDPKTLGFFTGAYIIGNLLGKTILGRLSDRFKNTTVFIVAQFLMVVFVILMANTKSPALIIFFSIIVGILTKGTIPVRTTMVSESNRHHQDYNKAFSVASFVSEIANTSSPIILGKIADHYGVVNSFNSAAIVAFIAIIPAYFYSKYKQSL